MYTEEPESFTLQRSLESLIEINGDKWFRFILGILRNESDAEDALQEAVRRVLTRNRSFPSRDQVRMYLGRAIGNTAFEMYNRRKRDRRRNMPIQESTILYDDASGPDICMVEKEENNRKERMLRFLDSGLKRLPEKQEEAIRMTILESNGRSLRKVCAAHNIPYSTLRHRNRKGLERMRSFLEQALKNEKQSKV